MSTSLERRDPAPTAAPAVPALGRTARIGSAWAVGQSVGSKLASLLCQILIARFLLPEDMGVASMALSVFGLLLFLNPAIMSDVLIQRRTTLDRDAGPALWLTVLLSLATGAALLATAPLFAAWYRSEAMLGLLALLALRPLAMALQVASLARLRVDFRFGAISAWSIWVAFASSAATVLLAWMGAGAYSIVVPFIAANFALSAAFGRLAPSSLATRPNLVGSRPLLREWVTLCGGQYAHTISLYVDYLILAIFVADAEVGFYFFAFNLSGQLNGIVIYNISLTLQPIFAALKEEPARQMHAFLRAASTLSAVSVPLCLLQAALADAIIRVVFGERWVPAIPLLTILSLAQSLAFTIGPTIALLKSQGRFRTYLLWQLWQTALLVPAIALAAWYGAAHPSGDNASAILVSWVIVLQFAISAPLGVLVAIRPAGGTLRDAARPFTRPLLAAGVVIGPAWYCASLLPVSLGFDLLRLAVLPLLALALYPFALRVADRAAYDSLRDNALAVLRGIRSRAR